MGDNFLPPRKVKICGITEPETLKAALEAGANYIGFIFVPDSVRYISPHRAASLIREHSTYIRPNGVRTVAVMVDPSDDEIAEVVSVMTPDYLQFHGSESPERLLDVARVYDIRLIKALPIAEESDLAEAERYIRAADALLFDAKSPDGIHGGKGVSFDWTLLRDFHTKKKWFLSGGLTPENVQDAIRITNARYLDVSSGVESSRGVKDAEKIRAFLAHAKSI